MALTNHSYQIQIIFKQFEQKLSIINKSQDDRDKREDTETQTKRYNRQTSKTCEDVN